MKKLTVLLLLFASFAQAQLLTEPASYTVSKSGSGIKLASNKGLIKFFTAPVVTGEPRAIYPLNLASVKFTQNGVTAEVPWTYVVNVGGSAAASSLAGLVDQVTALVSTNSNTDSLQNAQISANTTSLNTKSATINAATYAAATTAIAALPAGVGAIVKIEADESPGNAGTGTAGANPRTYYLYFPTVGLIQQVTYPN